MNDVQEFESADGLGAGAQDTSTPLYQAVSVYDGCSMRYGPGTAMVADFQPPYFPPPYPVPHAPTGASSTLGDFPSAGACPPPAPRCFPGPGASMYGAGVQPTGPGGLQPPSSAIHPAADVGGGAAYGVASPRRAAGGGGEMMMMNPAKTAAGLHDVGIFQATSTMPEFNFDNITFTPARTTIY